MGIRYRHAFQGFAFGIRFRESPLAFAEGAPGKEILQPMATVIIGGLLSSTLLSLVLTPAAFSLLATNKDEWEKAGNSVDS